MVELLADVGSMASNWTECGMAWRGSRQQHGYTVGMMAGRSSMEIATWSGREAGGSRCMFEAWMLGVPFQTTAACCAAKHHSLSASSFDLFDSHCVVQIENCSCFLLRNTILPGSSNP